MQTSTPRYILALDQGTTSSRAILFDHVGTSVAVRQQEFTQYTPHPGHVEHDANEIWTSQRAVAQEVLAAAGATARDVAAIGIANQRETIVLWDASTGEPVAPAIVWQSRITADYCAQLKQDGVEPIVREKTGLLLDPYFSGTKIRHLLATVPGLRARAERGEVLFGTIDSFLIWRLTGGRRHVTDYSNASRTLLLNIHSLDWDDELLRILDIPRAMLPELIESSTPFGETTAEFLGHPVPLAGCAGDQQAATFGQCCFATGQAKNTYGTGAFLLLNVGHAPVEPPAHLLTTVGWVIGGQPTYCLEGSIFICGAAVQWLRDGLGIIEQASDIGPLAAQVADNGGVVFVPALVGLGAPHWDPHARGVIHGISRGTTAAHLARATLEAMAHQSADVLEAMQSPSRQLVSLRVDGGAANNDLLLQIQADLLGVPVQRPRGVETTALGAAYLAGLATGFWPDQKTLEGHWQMDREFQPAMPPEERSAQRRLWQRGVERSLRWHEAEPPSSC